MKYFVFCQSDLVLEKIGDTYQIPIEAPTELKPWTTVMDIDGNKAYRIDAPLTSAISHHTSYILHLTSDIFQIPAAELVGLLSMVVCVSYGHRNANALQR